MISIKHTSDPLSDAQYVENSVHAEQGDDGMVNRELPCKDSLQEALSRANKLLDEAEKISRKLS